VQQTIKQDARKGDLQAHALSGGNALQDSTVYGISRPEHVVSEGLLALAEHKRPEATLLSGLS